MPQALIERPELWPENEEYMQGFTALNQRREPGMAGIVPIRVAEMQAYCDILEIEARQLFFRMISKADATLVDWYRKRKDNGA